MQRKRKTWIFRFSQIVDQESPVLSFWSDESRASECYSGPIFIKKTEKIEKQASEMKKLLMV